MQTLSLPNPLAPTPTPTPDFLTQCAALGQTIFSRLHNLILKPSPEEKSSEDTAAIRNLETASRILKRIQEIYLTAQKAIKAQSALDGSSPGTQIPPKQTPVYRIAAHAPVLAAMPAPSAPSIPASTEDAIADLITAVDALEAKLPKNNAPHSDETFADGADPLGEDNLDDPLTDENLHPASAALPYASSNIPLAAPKPAIPFRPPLTRNQQKAARRKAKCKRR